MIRVGLSKPAVSYFQISHWRWTSLGRQQGPLNPHLVRVSMWSASRSAFFLHLFCQKWCFRNCLVGKQLFSSILTCNVYAHPLICQKYLCPLSASANHRGDDIKTSRPGHSSPGRPLESCGMVRVFWPDLSV